MGFFLPQIWLVGAIAGQWIIQTSKENLVQPTEASFYLKRGGGGLANLCAGERT